MKNLNDYRYHLPEKLIAQEKASPADHAKLLYCAIDKKGSMTIKDKKFYDLPDIISKDNVIFFNNSKVIRARIPLKDIPVIREYLPSSDPYKKLLLKNGEVFIYKVISFDEGLFEALVSDDKHFKPQSILQYNDIYTFHIIKQQADGLLIKLSGGDIISFLDKHAELPLPPYVSYKKEKEKSYQNIFSSQLGSVALPTAGLHFTSKLLDSLKNKGIKINEITLHVGLGTFKPIDKENIKEYEIHGEEVKIDTSIFEKIAQYKESEKKVLGVGTTTVRTLESLPYFWKVYEKKKYHKDSVQKYRNRITKEIETSDAKKIISYKEGAKSFITKLYITPGFSFKIVSNMITNFHLPGTSLLVLVSSIMGYNNRKRSYNYAIEKKYQFYSFGDGMLIQNLS